MSQTPNPNAIALARHGELILPLYPIVAEVCACGTTCGKTGTHPMFNLTAPDGSRDEQVIEEWWGVAPEAVVGIVHGSEIIRPRENGTRKKAKATVPAVPSAVAPLAEPFTEDDARLQHVLSHIEQVSEESPGKYRGLCAAHGDKHPSLDIEMKENGKIVAICRTHHCAFENIVKAQGLTTEVFFRLRTAPKVLVGPSQPEESKAVPRRKKGNRREIVAEYPYHEADGQAVRMIVKRFGDKHFEQYQADGKTPLGNTEPILFRLDRIQNKPTVYLWEGEKDVLTLERLGFPATTNPMGAGNWREIYTQQLIDAGVERVVIFPDNDDAGRDHATHVGDSCDEAEIEVKIVHLPGLKKKGDISDWVETGGTRDELIALIKARRRHQSFDGIISTNMGDVEPEDVQWLWPGRIPLGMLTIFAGPPGTMKSYGSLDCASRTTTGDYWPDATLQRAPLGSVVLLSAEDNKKVTIKPRLNALGADSTKIEKIEAVRVRGARSKKHSFSLATDLGRLKSMVLKTGAKLVIVDPVNSYLGGKTDGFKDTEVREVLDPLKEMAEELNIAVVLIMHVKKGAEEEIIYRISGSHGFPAVARSILFCTKDPEDSSRIYFSHPKTNIGPEAPTLAFRIGPDMKLVWDRAIIKLTAQEILSAQKSKPGPKPAARDEVKRWLLDYLKPGPQPGPAVERAALELGHTDMTLRRAREALGVIVKQTIQRDKKTRKVIGSSSTWTLPDFPEQPVF